MSTTLVMVGTRKGLWIGRPTRPRETGRWTGPHFDMEEVYSCMVDTRGRPAAAAGRRRSSWLGPQVWRSDDLGESWQETPNGAIRFPEDAGASVARVWQLAPGVEDDVVWAGTEPGAIFRSDDRGETFELERGLWDHPHRTEWNAGFGGQAFHTLLPHPDRPDSLTAAISTGGVYRTDDGGDSWSPRQPGHQGRVPARRAHLPRVRPVRAQGRPPPGRARAALPPEPRRRLPLRRRRRLLAGHRAAACPPSSASRSWSTRTTPTPSTSSRSSTPAPASRSRATPGCGAPPTPARPGSRSATAALPDDFFVGGDARRDVRRRPRRRPGSTSAAATARLGLARRRRRPGSEIHRTCPT